MRDRLIELVCEATQEDNCVAHCNYPPCIKCKSISDHLIANGVVVLPCKVGDVVWVWNQHLSHIYKNTVVCIKIRGTGLCKNIIVVEYRNVHGETSCRKFTWSQIGKQVFLTREEAEKALKCATDNNVGDKGGAE